jgi:hypothetical protein
MPNFQPTQVQFKDVIGYGTWDIGHGREHISFVQTLAAQTTPILLPDADLLSLLTSGKTLEAQQLTHQTIHNLLRSYTGVTGVDYTEFRLDTESEFYDFLQYHDVEHQQLRQALGLT